MSLGSPLKRVDAETKVTGHARYTDDHQMHGMRYAKYVRSPLAHAYVTAIDTYAALALPGVEAVFTYQDVPELRFPTAGHAWSLEPAKRDVADRQLLTQHVRHYGDGVAIVVARDALTAERAAALVEVVYQELPVITTAQGALAQDAPLIHPEGNTLKKSDISANQPKEAISSANFQLSAHFQYGRQEVNPG